MTIEYEQRSKPTGSNIGNCAPQQRSQHLPNSQHCWFARILLIEAIRAGLLTIELVEALADDLLAGQYRLPFTQGGFRSWAHENGLF